MMFRRLSFSTINVGNYLYYFAVGEKLYHQVARIQRYHYGVSPVLYLVWNFDLYPADPAAA
jgi:hypothetical protein